MPSIQSLMSNSCSFNKKVLKVHCKMVLYYVTWTINGRWHYIKCTCIFIYLFIPLHNNI